MADLFAECSDEEVTFRTDSSYAKKYDEWRRKEELMKAKARFGSDLEDSDSTEGEEEDEDASQWTTEHEKNFLCTLSALKGRDPKIYNKNEILFHDVETPASAEEKKNQQKTAKDETMTLKDYERKIIAEEGGVYADEEEQGPKSRLFDETQQDKLAYDQEQKELRDSLKMAAWAEEESSKEEDDGIVLVKKTNREEDRKKDEEEYAKWLKGETEKLSNKKDAKELANLRKYWAEGGEEDLNEAEKFLRDYVLNKRYLTAKEKDFRYEVDFSDDEKDLDEMAEFEEKYNFRFEDPDPEFIKRYPRTIENSMRRKDTRRTEKKAEKKARKELELTQYKEEVNRLKSFKKKEIFDKIEKLRTITGSENIAFDDKDIEGDFDPEEHDKRMATLFASYDDEAGEENYPELDDDADEDLQWEDWDKYEKTHQEPEGEHESSNDEQSEEDENQKQSTRNKESAEHEHSEDEDSEVETQNNKIKSKKSQNVKNNQDEVETEGGIERDSEGKMILRGRKSAKLTLEDVLPQKKEKKRKKSKFAEVVSKQKPVFDPEKDKSFEKYFDEYYKLDFEDVVGGMPTRFKYRKVVPNDFGLSTDEVLKAQDKELNKWCSLKKMVQYRSNEEENEDLQKFSKRKDHQHLKKKILVSLHTPIEEKLDDEIAEAAGRQEETKKKSRSRKNKKKNKTNIATSADQDAEEDETEKEHSANDEIQQPEKPARERKRKADEELSEEGNQNATKAIKASTKKKVAEKKSTGKHETVDEDQTAGDEETKEATASTDWNQLTAKQKKNRRNAITKKRKKQEMKDQLKQSMKLKKEKFRPLEELQMSEARMKAYGLNPNRVKGNLVYGKEKAKAKKEKSGKSK